VCCRCSRRDTQLREQDAHVRMHSARADHRAPSYVVITPPIATSRSTSTSRSVSPPGRQLRECVVVCSYRWTCLIVWSTARHREVGGITKSAAATTAAVREPTPILR
jgi:hypothetical protein